MSSTAHGTGEARSPVEDGNAYEMERAKRIASNTHRLENALEAAGLKKVADAITTTKTSNRKRKDRDANRDGEDDNPTQSEGSPSNKTGTPEGGPRRSARLSGANSKDVSSSTPTTPASLPNVIAKGAESSVHKMRLVTWFPKVIKDSDAAQRLASLFDKDARPRDVLWLLTLVGVATREAIEISAVLKELVAQRNPEGELDMDDILDLAVALKQVDMTASVPDTNKVLEGVTNNTLAVLSSFERGARNYRPNFSHSDLTPWKSTTNLDSESMLTQFQLKTHGATPTKSFIAIVNNEKHITARCGLCFQDCKTSIQLRVKGVYDTASPMPHSAMTNVGQHAVSRIHQVAILAYLKGARDTLKEVATQLGDNTSQPSLHDVVPPSGFAVAYERLTRDCRLRELILSQHIIDDASPDIMSKSEATPETARHLSQMNSREVPVVVKMEKGI